LGYVESISKLETQLRKLEMEKQDLINRLTQSKNTLGITMERENKLR
jgi:hypothetical protein